MAVAHTPRTRYESLDAWRGLACLLVVLFHSSVYLASERFDARVRAGGGSALDWVVVAAGRFWVGVPLFFVVSGYCIAASADAVRAQPGGVRRFFARRARRIYPPLWAAVALAVLVLVLLPSYLRPGPTAEGMTPLESPARLTAAQWAGNLTLTESWRPALGGPASGFVLGQLWTLCYEEQFYLVVGGILLVARRHFFAGVAAVTGLVVFNLSAVNPYPVRVAGAFTDGLWLAFAAGVAVYYRVSRAPAHGPALELLLLGLGAVWALAEPNPFDTKQTLAKYNACGCLFAAALCRLHRFDAAVAKARAASPLRFCGRMCYSLYLTHPLAAVPVAWACHRGGLTSSAATVLVTLPLCVVASVGLGYGFYRAVERRFLNAPNVAARSAGAAEKSPAPAPAPVPV